MKRDARRLSAAVEAAAGAAVRLRSSITDDASELQRIVRGEDDDLDRHLLLVVDAFVQRFQQMHEHMTHRLYPAFYRRAEFGERPPPMLKLLTWLEGVGLIDDRHVWGRIAETRNRLVHEYPLDPSDRSAALGTAVEQASTMLEQFERAMTQIAERDLLEPEND